MSRLVLAFACGVLWSAPALAGPLLDGAFVKKNVQPLDWKRLLKGDARVVYVGETHGTWRVTTELAAHMNEIRSAGITHLAIEVWSEDYQGLLERYAHHQVEDADLLQALVAWSQMHGGTDSAADPTMWRNYVQLMHAAREAEIEFVAIDMPREQYKASLRSCDRSPQSSSCSEDAMMRDRDMRMALNLSRALREQPASRILALVGSRHAGITYQPAVLLRNGWTSKSYLFAFRTDTCGRLLRELGFSNRRIIVDLSAATYGPSAPQVDIEVSPGDEDEGPQLDRLSYDGCINSPGNPKVLQSIPL